MEKHLNAKVQKLSKKMPQQASSFSTSLVLNPEEESLKKKHGILYVVFDVSGGIELDPLLVTKVVQDVLYDSYYGSDVASPIQALEHAILQVRDRITHLANDFGKSADADVDFNILTGSLWGNVLYLVQFGRGASFLVRSGEVRPVNFATEGNFSVASGIVKDEDVVILGTQEFVERFKPDELVAGTVIPTETTLTSKSSAMVLKFEVAKILDEAERIDFGMGPTSHSSSKSAPHSKETSIRSETILPDRAARTPSEVGMGGIFQKVFKAKQSKTKTPKPRIAVQRVSRRLDTKYVRYGVISIVALLFTFSVFSTLQKNNEDEKEGIISSTLTFVKDALSSKDRDKLEDAKEMLEDAGENVENAESLGEEIDETLDELYKINRVDREVFYDLRLVNESINSSGLVVLDNSVVVYETVSGKVYSSGLVTPKFVEETDSFVGIKSLKYFGSDLAFSDSEGYKVYDLVNEVLVEDLQGPSFGPTAPYISYIYSVSGSDVNKYVMEAPLVETIWANSEEINGAIDIAIDGNIYILKGDGSLIRFYQGEKEEFVVSGLDKDFSNPSQIVTAFDMDFIYISDRGNNRVVVLNKEGELEKQFVSSEGKWNDIKGIGVTQDEEMIFVLSGNKVYEVQL